MGHVAAGVWTPVLSGQAARGVPLAFEVCPGICRVRKGPSARLQDSASGEIKI